MRSFTIDPGYKNMSNTFDIHVGTLVRLKCHPNVAAPYHNVEGIVYHLTPDKIWLFLPKRVRDVPYGYIAWSNIAETLEDLGTSPKPIWEAKYPELARYWDHDTP